MTPVDWIDGFKLPKGTIVFINAWGLHHDETRFQQPDTFDPDHYKGITTLAPVLAAAVDENDRDHYGYGYVRPGDDSIDTNIETDLVDAFVLAFT